MPAKATEGPRELAARLARGESRGEFIVSDNGCWEWQRAKTWGGYGVFRRSGKVYRVHCEVAAHRYGKRGEVVMHTCDNPPCINPDHLRVATREDNMEDMRRKGRGFVPEPPDNSGEKNGAARLSKHDVRDIRRRYAEGGVTQASLAEEYRVHIMTVNDVIHRRTWGHITP